MANASNTTTNTNTNRWLLDSTGASLGDYRSYVNHNGRKRYFSSTDAKLYFGKTEMEEIVTMNWQMNEPKMPLYGYNSFTFDEIAVGSRIVQGTFLINFLIPEYLYKIIKGSQSDSNDSVIYSSSGKEGVIDHHKPHSNLPSNFNIKVRYGSSNEGKVPWITFSEVWLQGVSQVLSEAGAPIFEQYSFIARDMGYIH